MSPADAFRIADQPWPLPRLAPRAAGAHKGSFGTALIVGGSRGMSGAAALAGMAALRGGAGLVRVAVPDVCVDTVAAHDPAYMTIGLRADRAGRIALDARAQILRAAESATVIGLGPGLGRSLGLDALVAWLYRNLPMPLVVDADALNALSARPDALFEPIPEGGTAALGCGDSPCTAEGGCATQWLQPAGPRILTPHPGEFARLVGKKLAPEDRDAAAAELARRAKAVVVLKGHRTCTTDGQRVAINGTGNPGMASGGSGDVLTGLIVALACQGLEPFDAARLAVHVHGLAGDLAAAELGQLGTTAGDLVRFLPQAIRRCLGA